MMIQVTGDLERFVLDAVSTGRYATEDDVVQDALKRLLESLPQGSEPSQQYAEPGQSTKRLTKQEFQRHLVEIGIIDELPETGAGTDQSEALTDEKGEIVSEIVIRERLIEWLITFLPA
jgi:Arc/MetJ-type ribon-helix-helix transcriptional regulator